MGGYWFLISFVPDVPLMSIEVNVEGILGFSHILLLATSALDEIDDIAHLAGGCTSYVEELACGGTCKRLPSPKVLTCKATSVATWTAPMVWLTLWRFMLGTDQEVVQALWSAVGHNRTFWDGLL